LQAWYTNRNQNAYVADSKLVIAALKENDTQFMSDECWADCLTRCTTDGTTPSPDNSTFHACVNTCGMPRCDNIAKNAITSARLRTFSKFSIAPSDQYQTIRIEISMDIPKGDGLWPAFWMLPEAGSTLNCSGCGVYGYWPRSGEIDIVEAVNGMNNVFGTIHYGDYEPNARMWVGSAPLPQGTADSTGYNSFALEWEATQMRWYLNGQQFQSAQSGNGDQNAGWWTGAGGGPNAPFDQPFHLLINLAVGGSYAAQGYQEATGMPLGVPQMQAALLPDGKQMYVDYVRVCGR